jgi:polysaccharide biosynthesis transport protein
VSTPVSASGAPLHGPSAYDLHDDFDARALAPKGFDFRQVVAAIQSNLWLILLIVAAALGVALVSTLLQTKRFTASSSIQISNSSGRVLGSKEDDPAETGDFTYDVDRFLKTQVDVLQSRGLALRVAQKLNLIGNPRLARAHSIEPAPAGTPADVQRDTAIALLEGNLSVNLPRDSRIVAISYVSADADLSAQIANAYADEFIRYNLQQKYDSSSYARNFLQDQLDQAKVKLEASERAVNTYARENGLINTGSSITQAADGSTRTDRGSSVTSSSMQQLNQAANDATARRIEAEGRWRTVSTGPLLSSPVVLANPTVVTLLSQRASLEADLSQDRARHLEDYPSVKAKEAQLGAINQQLNSVAGNVRNSVRQDYLSASATEKALSGKVDQLKSLTLSEQDKSVQYNLLAREADTNRQLYDGLLERFKTLNAMAGVSLSNIAIIDNAEVPKAPSSPNLLKNLLLGLIFGLGLATLLVFLRDQFDDAIRVPEDIEGKLGLPLLGVVPKTIEDSPELALADPKSAMSEAYNSLRGSLLYSTSQGLPQIMLITSAQAAEGKTTTSLAIATGFARMGRKVLLIDADMRRPSLHSRMNVSNKRGLSTLLTSTDSLESMTLASSQANLGVLPAGPIPPSPTELLSTARMEELLQGAAQRYDVVVVDSPPILGLADAPLMSALVDGVIIVVEADRSRRGALKSALRRLRTMRPVLLGAVLTKFDPLKSANRHSEYYGHQYYQYETVEAKD